jgi:hypothetical protein
MASILRLYIILLAGLCVMACSDGASNRFLGVLEWGKTYGGSHEDAAASAVQTQDGNLAVFGTTSSINGNIGDKIIEENDYWLMLLDLDGNMLWSRTYGGSGDDVGQHVIQTNDLGFAIVGYSMSDDGDGSNNEGFHDNWILKLDASGNIEWEKSFGFAGHDHAYSVTQTVDGGYFITGFIDVTASGGEGNRTGNTAMHGVGEYWCHKLDPNGNVEWRRYFGGTNNDRSFAAVQADDGGYVITGFSESDDFDISGSKGSYDYWVIKLDGSGNMLWERSFGGSEVDQSRAIVKTRDNGYIIAGNSFSTDGDNASNLGSSDFLLVKINDLGETVWIKNYGGSEFDYATSIKRANSGYVLSGYSRSADQQLNSNYGDNDFWVLKINEKGEILWQKSFGGSGRDLAFDAIETSEGHVIVVGETESTDHDIQQNKGRTDVLVIKIR